MIILARISGTVSSHEILKTGCTGFLRAVSSIRILLSTHVRVVLLLIVAWGLGVGLFPMLGNLLVVALLIAVVLVWLGHVIFILR